VPPGRQLHDTDVLTVDGCTAIVTRSSATRTG
jgi:hypothetical protein